MRKMSLILVFVFCCEQAWAHSGGTDANGCHRDYQNGGYHCHNKK